MIPAHLIQQLRNIPVHEIIRALERDGFVYRRMRGSGRVYRRPGGGRAVIHYHDCFTPYMIHRLPVDARTRHGHHRTRMLLPPVAQGDKLTVGGPTVDKLCRDLAIVTDPTQTCRPLRRMPSDTATDRVEHVHEASLLHLG